jgi:hypothetical protein
MAWGLPPPPLLQQSMENSSYCNVTASQAVSASSFCSDDQLLADDEQAREQPADTAVSIHESPSSSPAQCSLGVEFKKSQAYHSSALPGTALVSSRAMNPTNCAVRATATEYGRDLEDLTTNPSDKAVPVRHVRTCAQCHGIHFRSSVCVRHQWRPRRRRAVC